MLGVVKKEAFGKSFEGTSLYDLSWNNVKKIAKEGVILGIRMALP